ncbi:MAG: hypothetical protein KC994_02290 [Candidatus Omnitrophica bacterium]|nr:hypothetical protein [Candidatus Omnitrophota bacterium]
MADQDFLTDAPSGGFPARSSREELPVQRPSDRTKLKVGESRGFTLREVIRLLFKHKWILLLPLIIIPPVGYIYSQTLTPVYVASTRLQIQSTELAQLLPEETGAGRGGGTLLNDQVLLLLSDSMLAELVDEMHLDELMPIAGGQDMEKNEKTTAVIRQLKANVLTVTALRNTRSIVITAQWPENKDMPMYIANALANAYVARVRGQITEAANTFENTYDMQSKSTEEDLNRVNNQIEDFLKKNSVASVDGRMQALTEDLSRVRGTLWNNRNELTSLEVEIESIEKQLSEASSRVQGVTAVVVNPEYTQAQNYLDGLMYRRLNELGRWKPDSPRILNLDNQIDEAERRLQEISPQIAVDGGNVANPRFEELQNALPQLRILKTTTERRIETLEDEEAKLNQEIIEFGQVKQEYDQLRTTKEELLGRLRNERDRMAVAQNQKVFIDQITDVKIADEARRPLAPSPTKKNTIILMSIAAAFATGFGLAGAREFMNQTMETTDDVHKHLQLPVLGAIPDKVLR